MKLSPIKIAYFIIVIALAVLTAKLVNAGTIGAGTVMGFLIIILYHTALTGHRLWMEIHEDRHRVILTMMDLEDYLVRAFSKTDVDFRATCDEVFEEKDPQMAAEVKEMRELKEMAEKAADMLRNLPPQENNENDNKHETPTPSGNATPTPPSEGGEKG